MVPTAADGADSRIALDAPAKINLFLHVTGRRADGYHELSSLIAFATAADRLTAEPGDGLTLTVTGPFAHALHDDGGSNLVLRAAEALRDAVDPPHGARLVLDKRLPVASGIGGGSADAAATLRLLDRLWNCGRPDSELARIGAALGADVPVCLAGRPSQVSGIGDVIAARGSLPACGLVLVNGGEAVSTPAVFAARRGAFSTPADPGSSGGASAATLDAFVAGLSPLKNDLAAPAIALSPVVGEVLEALDGTPDVVLSRVSGSGGTCFGIYPDAAAARTAAALMATAFPAWWVAAGRFRDDRPEIRADSR